MAVGAVQSCRTGRARGPGILAAPLLAGLLSCGGGGEPEFREADSNGLIIARIARANPNPTTPEQVAEAFALGSDATSFQRELMEKEFTGCAVQWEIPVYEIVHSEANFTVVSQPIPVASPETLPMLRVVAHVWPQSEDDGDLLRAVRTNDRVTVRGVVREIWLRAAVVLDPAVVVRNPTKNENQNGDE